jgi:Polysaccharide deacetylase
MENPVIAPAYPVSQIDAKCLPWPQPISLSVNIMLEGWTDEGAPGLGPMGNPLKGSVLDRQARSWAAYGPNYGARNLLQALKDFDVNAVFYVSGIVAERFGDLVGEIASQGHVVAAHAWAQDLIPAYRSEAEERADLKRSIAAIERSSGAKPNGWMSPRCTTSANTEALLTEHGFLWSADTFDRDLPGPVAPDSPLIGMPFTTVVNDMPLSIRYGNVPRDYSASLRRILNKWSSARLGSACLDITAHSHVFGRPHGIIEFRTTLEMAKSSALVHLTTHAELAEICRRVGGEAHG